MIWVVHPGSGTLIRIQICYLSQIPDPDPQHCILEEKYRYLKVKNFISWPPLPGACMEEGVVGQHHYLTQRHGWPRVSITSTMLLTTWFLKTGRKKPENCHNNFYWWDGETSVRNDADPDPTFHLDADLDPDPDPTTLIRFSILMPISI
jgi:hypothetical protein